MDFDDLASLRLRVRRRGTKCRLTEESRKQDANRFDELHASLCRNGVDAVGAVAYLSMLSRPAGLNPTGAEAD